MMPSATDVITYIGVPLAVLGVLPILYTFVLGVFTRRRIHGRLLQHGHKPVASALPRHGFTIRSSPMTTLVEVELPRYTISPLDRSSDDYWQPADIGSEAEEEQKLVSGTGSTLSAVEEGRVVGFLRGGSWRGFQWRRLAVGKRLYRIQYEDELREPPADIDFSELVHYLLDWGAIPDAIGWEKLRSAGLWSPAGTILMTAPNDAYSNDLKGTNWVLRTTMPDESDGVLSLTVRWPYGTPDVRQMRGPASLPPGWSRLSQPALIDSGFSAADDHINLPRRIDALRQSRKSLTDTTSFRFNADDGTVKHVAWECFNLTKADTTTTLSPNTAKWFTTGTSALLTLSLDPSSISFHSSQSIDIQSSFACKDTVPVGTLVILDILPQSSAPQFSANPTDPAPNHASRFHAAHLARMEAERLEAIMPSAQAAVHKQNRLLAEQRERAEDFRSMIAEQQKRKDKILTEALSSPRLTNAAVAAACLAYLVECGEVGKDCTIEKLAEAVLFLIAVSSHEPSGTESSEADRIIGFLDQWMAWSTIGTMTKQQYQDVAKNKVEFCFAAVIVGVLQTAEGKAGASVMRDVRQCLEMWKDVRLG